MARSPPCPADCRPPKIPRPAREKRTPRDGASPSPVPRENAACALQERRRQHTCASEEGEEQGADKLCGHLLLVLLVLPGIRKLPAPPPPQAHGHHASASTMARRIRKRAVAAVMIQHTVLPCPQLAQSRPRRRRQLPKPDSRSRCGRPPAIAAHGRCAPSHAVRSRAPFFPNGDRQGTERRQRPAGQAGCRMCV
jgi:hypothetical protein